MDGNEEFVSTEKLAAAYESIKEQYRRMTEECKKLLQHCSDVAAELNQLKVMYNQTTLALDIAQNDNMLLRDANRSLIIALTETAR